MPWGEYTEAANPMFAGTSCVPFERKQDRAVATGCTSTNGLC